MKRNKPTRKRLLLAALLLLVYGLLLVQEVVINQVWCYRSDGSVQLELAFLGFRCECINEGHDHEAKTGKGSLFCAEAGCCVDRPVDDSWLQRVVSPFPGLERAKAHVFQVEKKIDSQTTHIDLSRLIPLSKFLEPIPLLENSVVLRC